MATDTMKAVVLKEPFKVAVEQVPTPSIQEDGDVIIQVHLAGLCGSDLHCYRGHEPGSDYTMGHEVLGEVVEVGKGVKRFKKGDMVISPFSLSCGSCYYCDRGYTARCSQNAVYGSPSLPGCQAEYFRQPLADGCLFHLDPALEKEGISRGTMLLLADVLPTGLSSAWNARRLLDEDRDSEKNEKSGVAVVIGCGPVGLCAIISALTLFTTVIAVDPNTSRQEQALKHGAHRALSPDELKQVVLDMTEGRGADAALEIVGNQAALDLAVDVVRPCGAVSCVGVHNGKRTLDGEALYGKNLRFQFGRCSVRTHYERAVQILRDNKDLFAGFIQHEISFNDVEEYYKLFEKNKVGKTVFVTDAGLRAGSGSLR